MAQQELQSSKWINLFRTLRAINSIIKWRWSCISPMKSRIWGKCLIGGILITPVREDLLNAERILLITTLFWEKYLLLIMLPMWRWHHEDAMPDALADDDNNYNYMRKISYRSFSCFNWTPSCTMTDSKWTRTTHFASLNLYTFIN